MQKSLWHVDSNLSAQAAADAVHTVMDNNDSLIVIDSTNNNTYWYGLSEEVALHIQNHWSK